MADDQNIQAGGAGQQDPNQQPPQGYNPQGMPPQGWGPPPQGYNPQGMPPQGWGPPPQGWGPPPQGYNPQGMPPQGWDSSAPQQPVQPIGSFGRDDTFATTIRIPKHALKFDEQLFLKLLAGSISLTKDEKKRVIEAIPRLSQQQIEELVKILQEEKRKFSELDVKHREQLRALENQHKVEWEALEAEFMSAEQAEVEQSKADDIRSKLAGGKKDN